MELKKEKTIQSQEKIPSTYKELHCNYCPRRFTEQKDLVQHVSIVHHNNFVKKFDTKEFPDIIHCNYCGERFTEHKHLAQHASVAHHDVQKPNLKRQIGSLHEGRKSFKCDICDYSSLHKQNLKKHIESVHEKTKPFKCDICDYRCSHKHHLKIHIGSVHEKTKPFKCDMCDYRCSHKPILKRHIESVHEITKPFRGNICHRSFPEQRDLVRHVSINHHNLFNKKENNFYLDRRTSEIHCKYCGKKFTEQNDLALHVSIIHKNDVVKKFTKKGNLDGQTSVDYYSIVVHNDIKSETTLDKSQNKSQITTENTELSCIISKERPNMNVEKCQENLNSLLTCTCSNCIQIISCLKCNSWFTSKRDLETHICNFLCSKCCVTFCSQDSLKLHFNSCEGPKKERRAEKLQITKIVDTFSCSKCDMDFDLRKALEKHSENCEIVIGEEHFDHTYSKKVSTATSVKEMDLFGTEQGNLLKGVGSKIIRRKGIVLIKRVLTYVFF